VTTLVEARERIPADTQRQAKPIPSVGLTRELLPAKPHRKSACQLQRLLAGLDRKTVDRIVADKPQAAKDLFCKKKECDIGVAD